jgi:hypothetical protein
VKGAAMTYMFRLLLIAAGFVLSPLSHAVTYEIDSQNLEIPEPSGFISLKVADEKNLKAFYIKNDPILVDFYCNVGEPSDNGACNHHRTLSLEAPKDLMGREVDTKTFATIKEGTRKLLKDECSACMKKQKSASGVKDVEFAGVFADTDMTVQFSKNAHANAI